MPIWLLRSVQVVGIVWAAPVSVLGLVAGLAALAFGAHVRWNPRYCALVFHKLPWGPGGALTLGNVILHTGTTLDSTCQTYAHRAGQHEQPLICIGNHERAHVYQYMVLGALFLPLYGICGGVSARNPFERAADRYALTGKGWWPFRRTAS